MPTLSSKLAEPVWQDRDIRFDISVEDLQCRRGEFVVDSINAVEDTKGNNGIRGALSVTNLRILWCSHKNPRVNLSIGLNCITALSIKGVSSQLRGHTQALYIMTRFKTPKFDTRFEFIFTSLVRNSPRLFTTIQAINRAYETTRPYRDVKLRGALITGGQVDMLPDEQLVSRRTGVWNLSYEQGNLGVLVVTNVRLVWFADKAENFNVSIPWIEMRAVALREHSVGPIMVVETSERGGGYTLGFRFADAETLQQAVREAVSCHGVYTAKPVFGVKAVTEARTQAPEQVRVSRVTDDVAVERTAGEGGNLDLLQAYFGDEVVDCDRAPELDAYLGLAVETVREGLSLDELWHVIS